jgi:plasmid replication initiation protein
MANRTVLQRTNVIGFPKAGELIEITGAHELEASDRAILNLLYQHAHDSGRMGDRDVEWEIPMAALRASRHKGSERIRDSLDRLMRVVVTVPLPTHSGSRILKTHLFDFFDLTADEASDRATVRFGLPKKLQPVLAESTRWGRIKAEVVCAMTSKYAIALYEMIQLRANMDRCVEPFSLERIRDLLGVPPGAYERGNDFARFVIQPAMLEVNGLSDVGVDMLLVRRSRFGPIQSVTVTWWKKEGDEFRAALRERNQSKVGRMARLKGAVESATPRMDALA